MPKFSVAIVIVSLVCWIKIPAYAQTIAIVGDARLSFPAMKGFKIPSNSSISYLEGERWTTPSNRLLAIYVPTGNEKNSAAKAQRRIAVQSFRKYENIQIPLSQFQSLRNQFRTINQSALDAAKKNSDKHQPKNQDGTLATSANIEDVSAIELFNQNSEWSTSMLTLVNYTRGEDGKIIAMPTVMGTTAFLIKGKICFLYVYSAPYTPASVKWVKASTLAWLSEAHKNN